MIFAHVQDIPFSIQKKRKSEELYSCNKAFSISPYPSCCNAASLHSGSQCTARATSSRDEAMRMCRRLSNVRNECAFKSAASCNDPCRYRNRANKDAG
jgi:hypothetical protein